MVVAYRRNGMTFEEFGAQNGKTMMLHWDHRWVPALWDS